MTKLNSLIVMGIFSIGAFANTQPPTAPSAPTYFNGPYIALGIGGVQSSLKEIEPTFDASIPAGGNLVIDFNAKNTRSARSPKIEFASGYNKLFNKFYLGTEVGFNFSSLKSNFLQTTLTSFGALTVSNFESTANVKAKLNFFVLFKPGLLIETNTSCYGIVGAVVTKLSIAGSNYFYINGLGAASASKKSTRYLKNIAIGFGAQHYINSNISLAFEYIYTVPLHKVKLYVAADMIDGATGVNNGPTSVSRKFKISSHSICIKTAYHF